MYNQETMLTKDMKTEQFKMRIKALIVSRDQLKSQNDMMRDSLARCQYENDRKQAMIDQLSMKVNEAQMASSMRMNSYEDENMLKAQIAKLVDQNRQTMELLRQAMDKVADLKGVCEGLKADNEMLNGKVKNICSYANDTRQTYNNAPANEYSYSNRDIMDIQKEIEAIKRSL